MKSHDGPLVDDRPRRPALSRGLPAQRAAVRQASPRRRQSLWSRRGLPLAALVLGAIGVAQLLHVTGAGDADVAQLQITHEEPVVEPGATPDLLPSPTVQAEPTGLPGPVLMVEPINTPVPELINTTVSVSVTMTPAAARPTPTPPPATATPAPRPTSTPAPAASEVWVGNTGGSGVYVRGTPTSGDRVRPYGDGTRLTIIGDDVSGDGQQWKHVRTPDGLEGYVPALYTTDAAP
jgi:hypothetical protein